MTLHLTTSQYITSHDITLNYITSHGIETHINITLQCITYLTLQIIHYNIIYYPTIRWSYIKSHYMNFKPHLHYLHAFYILHYSFLGPTWPWRNPVKNTPRVHMSLSSVTTPSLQRLQAHWQLSSLKGARTQLLWGLEDIKLQQFVEVLPSPDSMKLEGIRIPYVLTNYTMPGNLKWCHHNRPWKIAT